MRACRQQCFIATSAGLMLTALLGGTSHVQAQAISFTQTASGASLKPLDNTAPAVASKTTGTSPAPISGAVTKTQTQGFSFTTRPNVSAASPTTTIDLPTTQALPKDGLLIERRVTANVTRGYDGAVFSGVGLGVSQPVYRLDETFSLAAPSLGLATITLTQTPIDFHCTSGPCGSQILFSGVSPGFTLRDIKSYDPGRFDVKAPAAPDLFVDRGGSTTTLRYTPQSTLGPNAFAITDVAVSGTVTVEQVFRPWRLNEALDLNVTVGSATGARATPRFGFTMSELATLGGYASFNWLQEVIDFHVDGKRLATAAERIAEFGRGLGPDPLPGGNPGLRQSLGLPDADASPLYYDLVAMAGRAAYFAAGHVTEDGAQFDDRPQFFEKGRTAFFQTSLVGVRADGSYDLLADLFDDDRLTFRWSFEQTEDSLLAPFGGAGMLQNLDATLAGIGVATLLGFGFADEPPPDPPPVGAVPAPAGASLLALGMLALAVRRRQR